MNNSATIGKYPTANRSCTDVLCCLIFLVFWAASVYAAIYGFNNGNLENIAQPFDTSGNKCGENNVKAFPKLFFMKPTSMNLANRATVCVDRCPKSKDDKVKCFPNKNATDCDSITFYNTTMINDYCLPAVGEQVVAIADKMLDIASETAGRDILRAWQIYLICTTVAFLLALLYCLLLSCCAGVVVSFLVVGLLGGLIALGFFLKQQYDSMASGSELSGENPNPYFYGYWICWGTAGVLALVVCCMWSRIMLAVSVIQATADFITDYVQVLFVPIFFVLVLGAFYAVWIYAGAYIFSTGESTYVVGKSYGKMNWTSETRTMWYIHLFSLLWNTSFFLYLSNFVIIYSAVTWYFASNKDDIGSPITYGFVYGVSYHIGSIAFGSLVLALVWSLQAFLAYLQQQKEQLKGGDNACVNAVFCIVQCLVECFERFIKFLSKHAFIEMAMKSTNFCTSAQAAMSLIVSNGLRLGIMHGLCSVAIGFGVIFITICTIIVGFFLETKVEYFRSQLTGFFYPLLIVALIGYVVAQIFGHVFDVSADAIIHSYIVEESETGTASNATEKVARIVQNSITQHGHLLENEPNPGYGAPVITEKNYNQGYTPSRSNAYR